MNNLFKTFRIRLKWLRRKKTRQKSRKNPKNQIPKKDGEPNMHQNNQSPNTEPEKTTEQPEKRTGSPCRKRNPLWRFLLKLLLSLTQLFRLIRLLAGLIRKNWNGSGKN